MNYSEETDVECALLDVIAGGLPGQYLIVGNWNYASDQEHTTGIVVAVDPGAEKLRWAIVDRVDTWLTNMKRLTPASYLLCTAQGELIRFCDGQGDTIATGLAGGIQSVWGVADTDCWLIHQHGLAHWDGAQLGAALDAGPLYGIHGLARDFVVAVGRDGKVVLYKGTDWIGIDSIPTRQMLVDVFCVSRSEIYVSGWGGTLYRWDGKHAWTRIDVVADGEVLTDAIGSIAQFQGDIYVGAAELGLYKIAGNVANRVKEVLAGRVAVVQGRLVVTGWDSLAEFDGRTWRHATITVT